MRISARPWSDATDHKRETALTTVLSVAYPFAPVREDTAGGAEQVLAMLDAGLVREGAASVVLACSGSRPKGLLVKTPRVRGELTPAAMQGGWDLTRRMLEQVLADREIDLVHMHGIDFDRYLPDPGVPVLATLHLPPGWYSRDALSPKRPRTYLQCVSASQSAACPDGTRLLPFIENGVPVGDYPYVARKCEYAVLLGRICPEKGFHLAIDAARKAGLAVVVAGEVFPYAAHQEYFEEEIVPRIDGSACRFIGRVGGGRKARLLAGARCLLVPSLAPETSSLSAMEALACGTPVIAFPAGALADIVESGLTGFLVRSEDEMAEAIREIGRIDPLLCRLEALRRFSADRMIRSYFDLYRRIIGDAECE